VGAGGAKGGAVANPEEVDLDMDEGGEDEGTKIGAGSDAQQQQVKAVDGEEGEDEGEEVEVRAVPASVYGSMAPAAGGTGDDKGGEEGGQGGAMERLKKRRAGQ